MKGRDMAKKNFGKVHPHFEVKPWTPPQVHSPLPAKSEREAVLDFLGDSDPFQGSGSGKPVDRKKVDDEASD